MDKKYEGVVTPVKAPGERYDGTFREAYQEIFGVSDEQMAEAAERVRIKMQKIDEAERQAAIKSRNIIIGSAAIGRN